jgi:hypothetical protein
MKSYSQIFVENLILGEDHVFEFTGKGKSNGGGPIPTGRDRDKFLYRLFSTHDLVWVTETPFEGFQDTFKTLVFTTKLMASRIRGTVHESGLSYIPTYHVTLMDKIANDPEKFRMLSFIINRKEI